MGRQMRRGAAAGPRPRAEDAHFLRKEKTEPQAYRSCNASNTNTAMFPVIRDVGYCESFILSHVENIVKSSFTGEREMFSLIVSQLR